jgi:hypothetical protein
MLAIFGELLFAWDVWWRWRRATGIVMAAVLLVAMCLSIVVLWMEPRAIVLVTGLLLVSAYSLFNIARTIDGRAGEPYLRHAAVTTFAWLALVQVLVVVCLVNKWYGLTELKVGLVLVAIIQLVTAIVVALNTARQLQLTRLPNKLPDISDGKLPTVTVAVPVRDEADQLEMCLTSILSNDYPKLEILAFDDQSTDKTPEVIRQFAHAGVRFIRSDEPRSGWLAKNQAYNELTKAASGEIILFCGADVRLDVRTIRRLVALMERRHKSMLAVLPQNRVVQRIPLLQAMRYYWELAPLRQWVGRPPVLSSVWLIRRDVLKAAGGFGAVRRSITPEAHLARYTAEHGSGYDFVRSSESLGAWSEKTDNEQRTTAIIRRYPQVHRRPELVLAVAFGQAVLLIGPIAVVLVALLAAVHIGLAAVILSVLSATLALVIHTWSFNAIQQQVFTRVRSRQVPLTFLLCIALDIWYLHLSMYRYEFGEVAWKGRDVAQPVMRRD